MTELRDEADLFGCGTIRRSGEGVPFHAARRGAAQNSESGHTLQAVCPNSKPVVCCARVRFLICGRSGLVQMQLLMKQQPPARAAALLLRRSPNHRCGRYAQVFWLFLNRSSAALCLDANDADYVCHRCVSADVCLGAHLLTPQCGVLAQGTGTNIAALPTMKSGTKKSNRGTNRDKGIGAGVRCLD